MRLSEAIRLGALLKPQAFDAYVVGGRTCALGAACDALGRLDVCGKGDSPMEFLWEAFPLLDTINGHRCPVCDHVGYREGNTIPHLNDTHRWSREQIADWVSTIEAQLLAQPAPEPVSVQR